MHGLPKTIAPKEQRNFAMILWLSDKIVKNKNINLAKTKSLTNKQVTHDYIPHTLLNFFGVQSIVSKKDFSLIN